MRLLYAVTQWTPLLYNNFDPIIDCIALTQNWIDSLQLTLPLYLYLYWLIFQDKSYDVIYLNILFKRMFAVLLHSFHNIHPLFRNSIIWSFFDKIYIFDILKSNNSIRTWSLLLYLLRYSKVTYRKTAFLKHTSANMQWYNQTFT